MDIANIYGVMQECYSNQFHIRYQIDTKEGSRHGNDYHVDRGSYNR